MRRRQKFSIQSGTAFSTEVAPPGFRGRKDARVALRHTKSIAGNSGGDKHGSTATPPTLIAVAVNDVEDLIDLVTDRSAETSPSERTDNHVGPILTPDIVGKRESDFAIFDYGTISWYE